MHALVTATLLASCLFGQQATGGEPAPAAGEPSKPKSLNPLRVDENGWPIIGTGNVTPAPAGETRSARAGSKKPRAQASTDRTLKASPASAGIRSGMANQALLDIYRCIGTPGQQQTLGGCDATWRLTVHAADSSVLGERIYHHVSDCAVADMDRLVYGDRVFVRHGDRVQAGSGGVRYESMQNLAALELELFGLHLRAPWCFADGARFQIVEQDQVVHRGVQLGRLVFERAAPPHRKSPRSPKAVDRFELLFDPLSHVPRVLEHRFAGTGQVRRVYLEDWQELMSGVKFPRRRRYVDDADETTTTIELMDLRKREVRGREFKLL